MKAFYQCGVCKYEYCIETVYWVEVVCSELVVSLSTACSVMLLLFCLGRTALWIAETSEILQGYVFDLEKLKVPAECSVALEKMGWNVPYIPWSWRNGWMKFVEKWNMVRNYSFYWHMRCDPTARRGAAIISLGYFIIGITSHSL